MLVDKKVLMPPEREISLPYYSCLGVADIVVLYNTQLLVLLFVSFVADADKHEAVLGGFPERVQGQLDLGHVVGLAYFLREFVDVQFAFGVISHVVSLELPLLVVSRLEPSDHRVLVGSPHLVLVGPLVVLRFIHVNWLTIHQQRVTVIAQFEPVVVVPSLLLDAQVVRLWECYYHCLVRLLIEKVMRGPLKLVALQVQYCY